MDGNGIIRPLSDGSGCSPIQLKLESGLTLGLPHGVNQMLRGIRLFSLLLLGPGAALYSPQAVAQVLNPTGLEQWDSTNQVLFFDGGSPDSPTRGYTDTHQRGADINIFKDFPGLQEFYGTSLTAVSEGTTLFATILNFGGHNIRRVVLTYDSSGQLLKTWEPVPQYREVIAYSKDDDAIFVLGDRYVPKWNPVEHRLFSFISLEWAGHRLRSLQLMMSYIGGRATEAEPCRPVPNGVVFAR